MGQPLAWRETLAISCAKAACWCDCRPEEGSAVLGCRSSDGIRPNENAAFCHLSAPPLARR